MMNTCDECNQLLAYCICGIEGDDGDYDIQYLRLKVNKLSAITRQDRLSTLFSNGARIARSYWRGIQAAKNNRG